LYTIEAKDMEPHMAEARESLRAGIIERFFTNIRENDYIKIGIATLLDIRFKNLDFNGIRPDFAPTILAAARREFGEQSLTEPEESEQKAVLIQA